MSYSLLIKNGTVVDGSGAPRFVADIGVQHGKIAAIGRLRDRARRTVDAEGHVVAPGFVDGHTHMDAQIFWDQLGSCSCYHGVTSVVMGNCGFTIAPCREQDADLVFRNLERAEDISREAMLAGIDWCWETFPEFLNAIDALPKGINYAGYIGHSALRTYVMGERAFTEAATAEELATMCRLAKEAVQAGGIGFSTSRTVNHLTADDRPVASRAAPWDEVRAIVNAVGETGRGVFEIAHEATGRDPERLREYHSRLRDLAVESGVPQTWGMFSSRFAPNHWRGFVDLVDETANAGGRMFVQVHSRALNVLMSFKTQLPFRPVGCVARPACPALARAARQAPRSGPARQAGGGGAWRASDPEDRWRRGAPAGLRPLLCNGFHVRRRPAAARSGPGTRHGSGGSDDRTGPANQLQAILPPARRQRESGRRAGNDPAPALSGDVLRFRRPREPDHG